MPLFFIEMGQGIAAKPELRVKTSALHSCTLIAGYSDKTGLGGAYHYPAEGMGKVAIDDAMKQWQDYVQPTEVTLIFSRNDVGGGFATSKSDRQKLQAWVKSTCSVTPSIECSNNGCMQVTSANQFSAGEGRWLSGNFTLGVIDVSKRWAGRHKQHGGFDLFGTDLVHDEHLAQTTLY